MVNDNYYHILAEILILLGHVSPRSPISTSHLFFFQREKFNMNLLGETYMLW